MLKSCSYCGSIHDKKFDCGRKPKERRTKYVNGNELKPEDMLRRKNVWKRKSLEIRKRDKGLCQVCIRNLFNTTRQYTTDTIEVHHIVPLNEQPNRLLDNYNLISVCKYHHNMAEHNEIPRNRLHDIAKEQEQKNLLTI